MSSTRKTKTSLLAKSSRLKRCLDWTFKDQRGRHSSYVIGEPANASLIVFTIGIIISLLTYKGFWHIAFAVIAYISLSYWSYQEITAGRSRFRKFLGICGAIAVISAVLLRLGLY